MRQTPIRKRLFSASISAGNPPGRDGVKFIPDRQSRIETFFTSSKQMKKIILLGILLAGIYPGIGYWAGYAQNAREFRTENIGSQEMTVTVDADFPRAIE